MQVRLFVGGLIWQLSPFRYFVLDLIFGQDGCEVFHLTDLADFDFAMEDAFCLDNYWDASISPSGSLCDRDDLAQHDRLTPQPPPAYDVSPPQILPIHAHGR